MQLTPGNLPTDDFLGHVAESRVPVRFHHAFAWERYRRPIYAPGGVPVGVGADHSVHPPVGGGLELDAWLDVALEHDLLVETMHPGELLGTGGELMRALDAGLRLAVDVSHLHIQWCKGALTSAQLARVLDAPTLEEVHVSANDGRRDRHFGIDGSTYLLDWARERASELPVVLESYWHRAARSERLGQLELLAG